MSEAMNGSVSEDRLRVILPDSYSERYDRLRPAPMNSAPLKFQNGRVAWDQIWGSFCDLAMAGGPPHRGRLLEPATQDEVFNAPDRHREVMEEVCRGIHLVTGLYAKASPAPGWVQVYCTSAVMADWLARAITIENVSAHRSGLALSLPAGPSFRIEKEIKNVVTAVAKTTHYWTEHTTEDRREAVARLFAKMNAETALFQPALRLDRDVTVQRRTVEQAICAATGLLSTPQTYATWVGFDCKSVPIAITLMRLLVVRNVLARREEAAVFVPVPTQEPARLDLLTALFRGAYQQALAQMGGQSR